MARRARRHDLRAPRRLPRDRGAGALLSLIPDDADASVDTLGVFVLAVTCLGLALWAGVAGRDIGRREVCDAICPGARVEDVPPYCICEDVP